MMDLSQTQVNTALISLLMIVLGLIASIGGWTVRTGLRLLLERLDKIVEHTGRINGRIGNLEQRMSSSEGREQGRGK